ncbi:DUF6408 family protein [Streptomyces triculaminicus]
MALVEYKPARRERIREVLNEIAVGVAANLLVTALASIANLLF